MRTLCLVLALAATACTARLGTRTFFTGGASTTGASSSPPVDDRIPASDRDRRDPEGRFEPYPSAPASPWAGVDGDQPARISDEAAAELGVRVKPFACTAAHDHCLLARTWFFESDVDRKRAAGRRHAVPAVFGPRDPGPPWNARATHPPVEGYTALRTVPATRALLAPGATVVALAPPLRHPSSGGEAYAHVWALGTVARVDWARGAVYLDGRDDRYWISATRVAVLSWRPGGRVTVLDGRARDALTVRAADVVLPAAAAAAPADPWAAIDPAGQPRLDDDDAPIATTDTGPCDAARDHCLRPWLWFVDVDGAAVPARRTARGFVHATRPDAAVHGAGMAYRTAPADAAALRPGALVIVYDQHSDGPGTEHDAMSRPWRLAKIARVLPDRTAVELAGGDRASIDLVRTAVVRWFPGERAEAVD